MAAVNNNSINDLNIKNIVLKSAFKENCFNFIHINPGSLKPHLGELRLIVQNTAVHAIAVSETWFSEKTNNNLVAINDFSLFRHDRLNKRGGGVAIYLRNGIKARIIGKSNANAKVEFLFLEIDNRSGTKLCFGVVYNPPANPLSTPLKNILSSVASEYANVIVVGDFNLNLLLQSKAILRFKDFLNSNALCYYSQEPTNFVPHKIPSQIDLALFSSASTVKTLSQLSAGSYTTHDIIFGSYEINFNGSILKEKTYFRNIKRINPEELQVSASGLSFDMIYEMSDVNDQVNHVTALLRELLNAFAPLKLRKNVVNNYHKWVNEELLHLINVRNFYYNAARTERNAYNKNNLKQTFKKIRNKVNLLKRKLHSAWVQRELNPDLPSKKLWENLRKLGVTSSKPDLASNFSVQDFNNFFTSNFTPPTANRYNFANESANQVDLFDFSTVSNEDTRQAISLIKTNACGHDELSAVFLKKLTPFLIPYLTHIINNCITACIFPKSWKVGVVKPIPKVSNPAGVDDFRPISILPCLSKILERIMHLQIIEHVNKNQLFYENQSGFRTGLSTNTAMLKVVHDISSAIEYKYVTILCLLDLKKAFELVDHETLLKKLETLFSFSRYSCALVKSYLNERMQLVKIGSESSALIKVTSGTPQGGILSALLFTLFINDLPAKVNANVHLYADDSQIYYSTPIEQLDVCVEKMNLALAEILNWAKINSVTINPTKSQAMLISNKAISNAPPVIFNNCVIKYVDRVKSLGLYLNSRLNFDDHVSKTCGSICSCVGMLSQSRSVTPPELRLKLVRALIVPKILYCSPIFSGCSRESWSKLNIAFNRAARYIYNIPRSKSVSSCTEKILGCSLEAYLQYRSCLMIFNLLKLKRPVYLYKNLIFPRFPRSRALGCANSFKCKQFKSSFFVEGVRLWNSLDANIRRLDSIEKFKIECLAFLASRRL